MFFSILVPTMGTREYELNRLLESLSLQTFKDFEVIVVSQINHDVPEKLADKWSASISIQHIKLERAGLSYARNEGLPYCKGEWVILSDDDAWYPDDGLANIRSCADECNIVLTQIFDPVKNESYKNYGADGGWVKNKLQLMSRSSIEIAFRREAVESNFNEQFGLGAKYVCGEEVDFLLNNFKKRTVKYCPVVTVYHLKKQQNSTDAQLFAKGAIYAKNFNRFIAFLITMRDKLKRRGLNSEIFWNGYKDYKAGNKR
ncbi:MAG: glycosyltransferase family 2 protein [Roseburia sp.]|nr:glycosyltransferase family 2 protein [Roseburia sp.]